MKEQKKLTLPILNTSIFAMVSMTLLIATAVSLLLYKEYSFTIRTQQEEFSKNQSIQAKNTILKSIDNYKTILEDYSKFPLLRLAVMQPDNSLEDAIDMMKSFSFLGEAFPLAICDFEGNPIHDFFESKSVTQEVHKTLAKHKDFKVYKNIVIENKNWLLISTPIILKGSTEGALCMLIPTTQLIDKALPTEVSISHYEVYNNKNLISGFKHKNKVEEYLQFSTELFDGIKITTFLDPTSLNNAQNTLFRKLLISIIIIISLITVLTFLIIKRFLLKPIISLCEMTYAVNQNQNSKPSAISSPIKELSMLKEDIKTMINTVNQRSHQLNEANSELEQRVKERTSELELKAEELEKLSKYKSEFLARMSHEIRTPMNAIIGYTDILKESVKESENLSQLKIISSSADALLTVINDILDFSKIEAGMMTIEKIPFNLNLILNDIKHLFTKSADDKGLSFDVQEVATDLQWLSGDPHRIRQVLINLTGNAIKFTPSGSVLVKAEAFKVKEDKIKLDIVIKDTGIGIPNNKIESIFNSFSQAEGSVSRQFGGTGLGLPISKELAELMDGSLNVFSKNGEGTTFRFAIILSKAEPVKDLINNSMSITWTRKPKILLVEDNIVNIKLAEKTLKNFGVDFVSCESGITALETLKKEFSFDLVLMDCQMPEMDGLEATREIRKMPNLDNIPIVAFTANAMQDEIEDCYKAGMNDYISKPFKKEVFCEKLRKWLKHLIESSEQKAI